MTRRGYLLLDLQGPQESLVESVERALDAIRERTGLLFVLTDTQTAGPDIDVYIWGERLDQESSIVLTDDAAVPAVYLMLETANEQAFETMLDALREKLPVIPLATLKQRAGEPGAPPPALVRMALATGDEPDEEVVQVITDGLGSQDPQRLDAAVMAAALTRWEEFVPALERVRVGTTDEGIERMAAQAIRDCGGKA